MKSYHKSKPETIQAMFGSIASQYDKANSILSFRLHNVWNKKLVKLVYGSSSVNSIADLCCGTGEIAFTFLKQSKVPCEVALVDFCQEMLDCAQFKAEKCSFSDHRLRYLCADVQQIPLENSSIDAATMAYGIRNVQDPKKCLQEVFRILKPGGKVGILELTRPSNSVMQLGHRVYLKTVLPILGKLITSNKDAYSYLCNSIQAFVDPDELKQMLIATGFDNVAITRMHGGIATIITATKQL